MVGYATIHGTISITIHLYGIHTSGWPPKAAPSMHAEPQGVLRKVAILLRTKGGAKNPYGSKHAKNYRNHKIIHRCFVFCYQFVPLGNGFTQNCTQSFWLLIGWCMRMVLQGCFKSTSNVFLYLLERWSYLGNSNVCSIFTFFIHLSHTPRGEMAAMTWRWF